MKFTLNTLYPVISIFTLEILEKVGNYLHSINEMFIFIVQVLIGFLTVIKLFHEIRKNKKVIDPEKLENKVKKEHPFLTSVLNLLKFWKTKN